MAALEQLTTVAAVKAVLGISDTTYDTVLEGMLDRAEDILADMCGRRKSDVTGRWTIGSVTQNFNLDYPERFILSNCPVDTVTSVTLATSATGLYVYPTTGAYRIDDDCRTLRMTRTGVAAWYLGLNTNQLVRPFYQGPTKEAYPYIEVIYEGGYNANRSDVPPALAAAAIDLCKQMFLDRDRDYGLQSESLGNYSYTQMPDASVIEKIRTQYLGQYLATPL